MDKELARAAKPVQGKKIGDPLTVTIYNITKEGFFLFTAERNIAFLHRSEADPRRYLNCGDEVTGRIDVYKRQVFGRHGVSKCGPG